MHLKKNANQTSVSSQDSLNRKDINRKQENLDSLAFLYGKEQNRTRKDKRYILHTIKGYKQRENPHFLNR